jgi:hypothetical protein
MKWGELVPIQFSIQRVMIAIALIAPPLLIFHLSLRNPGPGIVDKLLFGYAFRSFLFLTAVIQFYDWFIIPAFFSAIRTRAVFQA